MGGGGYHSSHLIHGVKATLLRLCREARSSGASLHRGAGAGPQSEQEARQNEREKKKSLCSFEIFTFSSDASRH